MARDPYPESSQLNRRVQVWKKTQTTNEIGQVTYTDVLDRTVWAQIVPQTGSMTWQQTETILTDVTHRVTVRYKAATGITDGDHLVYNGRRFEIKYIINANEANWMVTFYCEEVQDT